MNLNPAAPVLEQCRRTPAGLALCADGVELDYARLVARASRLAAALRERGIGRGSRVGVHGSRSLCAVEALLGICWSGAAWVPLGIGWPRERLAATLALARIDAMILDGRGLERLVPESLPPLRLLVVPTDAAARALAAKSGSQVFSMASLPDAAEFAEPAPMAPEDLAYLIFTSGTTGTPKGVLVHAAAVAAYLSALGQRKAMTPRDRASQFTELTFDPSLGEIFVPWYAGASLHVLPPVGIVSPAKFIRAQRLSIWGSAPAAIAWLRDTRSLQPGSLPGLRYSSFGGEPLPLASVRAWQAAAPNSAIDNLYGPTEATVDCAGQLVAPGATPVVTPGRGVLAIGTPHPGTELAVLGPDLSPVRAGETGELAIAGAQLSLGYLDSPDLTAARFRTLDGKRWYLTGDIALQDRDGLFHHLGRIDNQVKIQGHRVELEDIEAHARDVAGTDQVAAIAWPVEYGVAQAIVCFVACSTLPGSRIRELLRGRLPQYMVPAEVHDIDALPLNASGKLDRGALIALLGQGQAEDGAAGAA
jgi:amino acid adenylation domain-containing protein